MYIGVTIRYTYNVKINKHIINQYLRSGVGVVTDKMVCFFILKGFSMEHDYTVYMHITPNKKVYVGLTGRKPKVRWNNGKHYTAHKHFDNAIKKYGWTNIEHIIIADELTKEEACLLEIDMIKYWNATNRGDGYNSSTGGECSHKGVKYSEAQRRALSERTAGSNNSNAGKRYYNDGVTCILGFNKPEGFVYGRLITAEHKEHLIMAAAKRDYPNGKDSHLYGVPVTEATKKKISATLMGHPVSAETRKKLREKSTGKKPLKETRLKLSKANKGQPCVNKGKHWFTDGETNVMAFECPDGFKAGKLTRKK